VLLLRLPLTNTALLPGVLQDLLTSAGIIKSSKHHLTMLKGVTGVLKPGRLTLLLGPPGSGKTTLLKALSGMLRDRTNTAGLEVGLLCHTQSTTDLHTTLGLSASLRSQPPTTMMACRGADECERS